MSVTNPRTSDPQLSESTTRQIDAVSIDQVTWMAIINGALTSLYGISGACLPYEVHPKSGMSAILQIEQVDEQKFQTSLFACTFNMRQYYSDIDAKCAVRVNRR